MEKNLLELSCREYDLWKETQKGQIETNFISDKDYLSNNRSYFNTLGTRYIERFRDTKKDTYNVSRFISMPDKIVFLRCFKGIVLDTNVEKPIKIPLEDFSYELESELETLRRKECLFIVGKDVIDEFCDRKEIEKLNISNDELNTAINHLIFFPNIRSDDNMTNAINLWYIIEFMRTTRIIDLIVKLYLLPPYSLEQVEIFERVNGIYLPIQFKYYITHISRVFGKHYPAIFRIYDIDYENSIEIESGDLNLEEYLKHINSNMADSPNNGEKYENIFKDFKVYDKCDLTNDVDKVIETMPQGNFLNDQEQKVWQQIHNYFKNSHYYEYKKIIQMYCKFQVGMEQISREHLYPIQEVPFLKKMPHNAPCKSCQFQQNFAPTFCDMCDNSIKEKYHYCDKCFYDICDKCVSKHNSSHKLLRFSLLPHISYHRCNRLSKNFIATSIQTGGIEDLGISMDDFNMENKRYKERKDKKVQQQIDKNDEQKKKQQRNMIKLLVYTSNGKMDLDLVGNIVSSTLKFWDYVDQGYEYYKYNVTEKIKIESNLSQIRIQIRYTYQMERKLSEMRLKLEKYLEFLEAKIKRLKYEGFISFEIYGLSMENYRSTLKLWNRLKESIENDIDILENRRKLLREAHETNISNDQIEINDDDDEMTEEEAAIEKAENKEWMETHRLAIKLGREEDSAGRLSIGCYGCGVIETIILNGPSKGIISYNKPDDNSSNWTIYAISLFHYLLYDDFTLKGI